MRLRLDKLVLSAGLALAMVATSIPAIAGTTTTGTKQQTGWAYNGVSFTFESGKADLAKAVNSDYVAKDNVDTTVNGFAKITSTVAVEDGAITPVEMGETLTKAIEAADQESEGKSFLHGAVTITYDANYTSKVIPATTGLEKYTGGEISTTKLTAEEVKKINAAVAEKKAAIKELENSVTAFETTKPGVNPSVAADAIQLVEGSVVVNKLTDVSTDTTQEEANTVITELIKTYSLTQHVETTEKVTDLPDGYTYDVCLTKNGADEDNYEYHIWSQDSSVATNYKHQADAAEIQDLGKDGLMVSLTTLSDDVTYFLTARVMSTADKLIIPEVEDDNYKVTIAQAEGSSNKTIENLIDKFELANGMEHVAYLNITVKDSNNVVQTETTSEITFKIAVPEDVSVEGKTITWVVLKYHEADGEVTVVPSTVEDGYIVFSSKEFSDYALAYTTEAVETPTETPAEDPTAEAPANEGTQAAAAEDAQGTGTTSGTGVKSGDNSMMPLFMTTLLLALCAGSLAIYKEKKTN